MVWPVVLGSGAVVVAVMVWVLGVQAGLLLVVGVGYAWWSVVRVAVLWVARQCWEADVAVWPVVLVSAAVVVAVLVWVLVV